jgi:hypothetical protein
MAVVAFSVFAAAKILPCSLKSQDPFTGKIRFQIPAFIKYE